MQPPDVAVLVRRILDTHHTYLQAALPRLALALGSEDAKILGPFNELRKILEDHVWKEESILFPAILALAGGAPAEGDGVAAAIAQLRTDYERMGVLEATLRALAPDLGPLGVELRAMLDDLAIHTRTEDDVLFPAALALEAPAAGEVGSAPAPRRRASVVDLSGAPPTRVLRATRGVCGTCAADVPAAVVVREGTVRLEKTCPAHGVTSQLLSRRPEYWGELDRFYFSVNREEYPQRDYIVRMTERCNLACPICLAKANTEDTPDLDLTGLEKLLSERRGIKVDLMAAEPTLRPDLLDWVRKVKASGNIAALHTNGIKLANAAYVAELREAGVDEVFLQFDGLDDAANKVLRGRPLLKARLAALANLREHGIATSLIVVIARGLNEAQVSETFRFALRPENDNIREVFFLGLRALGSARHAGTFDEQLLMPDEIIDLLTVQEPSLKRNDIHAFNMIYFAMLSAFHVRKCLYVQHYMVAREPGGGFTPISEILDLRALSGAASRYAARHIEHPAFARAALAAAVAREGLRPAARKMAGDFLRLEQLFAKGMNLQGVPKRFLLLGFITACDPDNFDADVAINCGKGELSTDGGYTESSAVANVQREARFAESDRDPGAPRR